MIDIEKLIEARNKLDNNKIPNDCTIWTKETGTIYPVKKEYAKEWLKELRK